MELPVWAAYAAIPPITAGVAWLTNYVGIKMLFFPVNFVGFGKFLGWQGIIPRLRVRLTRTLVGYSVTKLATPKDILRALDEADVINEITESLKPNIDDLVDEIIDEEGISLWKFAPQSLRQRIYNRVHDNIPALSRSIFWSLEDNANNYLDIEELAVLQVQDRPEFLNELFLECAGKEMDFIIRSGIYFGAPLGIIQAIAWYFLPQFWVLPLFGVLAGALTNWIALQLIAHPANPKKIGPFTIQGLYLKRQQEVSIVFGETFCKNFLNSKVLISNLTQGKHSREVNKLIKDNVRESLDSNVISSLLAKAALKDHDPDKIVERSFDKALDGILVEVEKEETNTKLTKPIAKLIGEKMQALPSKEFQQLLLPAFNEDQIIVVSAGGILGGALGTLQYLLLFGG